METAPTPIEKTLAEVMREHPELCGNRTEALHELLCHPSDDYAWEDGRVVRLTAIREDTPECDPTSWWEKVSPGEVPQPIREHMASRRARIEAVRAAAEELARTPGPAPTAVWLPHPGSLLLNEPGDAAPEWRAACDEVWQAIVAAHCRAKERAEAEPAE